MPVADELAALRARGTVKATSSAISSKQTNYVYTTPQQQEVLRKQKAKQEKAAREEAEKSLRKHNAGGINDLWYKKLRELKARKRGARSAWKKKDKAGGDSEDERDKEDEEDVGLEVDMLPDHLVKALKEKYETENAEEALGKALAEEEEGKGTILSEVMADLDAIEEDKTVEHIDGVSTGVDEGVKKTDTDTEEIELPAPIDENKPHNASNESTPEIEVLSVEEPDEVPTGGKPVDEPTDEEPVEEVRTKIEQLSIDDVKSKSFDEEKKSESLLETADTEQIKSDDVGNNPPIIDETKNVTIDTIQQPKLIYNAQDKYFSTYDNTAEAEEIINLLDANQRSSLAEEQTIEIKEQLVALQDQIKDLMANW